MKAKTINILLKSLGPGLLYAAAAIGVSHLVQSTRAGAEFGFDLLWIVLLANIIKFPFFEFGPRYASATGESLISGYRRLGWWAIGVFLIMTFGTIFVIQAAVTVVTAGLAGQLSGLSLEPWQWSAILLVVCLFTLLIGHYHLLDRLIKVIMVILALTTIIALIAAGVGDISKEGTSPEGFNLGRKDHLFFLIALVGWMPAPLDISIWHSVWTLAKKKDDPRGSLQGSLMDFRIGYWGTTALALCFLSLGALVMYGSGEEMPEGGVAFAGQLIDLYTSSLGEWTYPIIGLAAFTTMFSTTLTVLDAYPRVLSPTTSMIFKGTNERRLYWGWILITAVGALVVLYFFGDNMRALVDLVTTLSFLLAPLFAIMNYRVITGKHIPQEARPGLIQHVVSWAGILFLIGFTVYFIYMKYVGG